jgi:hypothetical protein
LRFITMTRITLRILNATGLAGLAIVLVVQHQAQARLREENHSLRRQAAQLAELTVENQRLSDLVAQARQSAPQPAEPSGELLRLRGEIGVLRHQNQELARLLSGRHPAASSSAQASEFEPSAAWADVGNATPESAAETFSWAIKTGNVDKLAAVLVQPGNAAGNAATSVAEIAQGLGPFLSQIEASRLLVADSPTPDETTYWFQNRLTGGETIISPLTLTRVGNQWKVRLVLGGDKTGVVE